MNADSTSTTPELRNAQPAEPPAAPPPDFPREGWIAALGHAARHYRLPASEQAAHLAGQWNRHLPHGDAVRDLARHLGLRVKLVEPGSIALSSWRLPAIVQLRDGQVATITAISAEGEADVIFSGDHDLHSPARLEALLADADVLALPRPLRETPDARVDTYIRPYRKNWFRQLVLRDLRPYGYVLLASLLANTLGLAGILFSMQVYDRVVPAQSYPTLYVLFGGVLLAILFDFLLRKMRMSIIDILGKQADIRMSDLLFGHALRVRNQVRPNSTGTFIAQLRDLEQVRELLTSTTVAAIADIPFFLLFAFVLWYIGGPLVLVPIGALVLMVVPGLIAQRRLRTHATAAMRESSLRNAMLVEAVQGIEDIKTLQAEERFQQQWNHFCAVTSEAQLKLRALTNTLTVWSHNIQTAVFATIVFVGAPFVMDGDMTTGALVAASILGSRMMSPMAQLTQVLNRFQQAKIGMQSLDQIMQMPVNHPEDETRIHCPTLTGHYALKSARFRYTEDDPTPALTVRKLEIQPGERIAVLGKNGAGKSTLLQALSGLLEPDSGEVLLDELALRHIDPADVRRDIGLLTQNARLFYGTLRDNIILGAPEVSAQELTGVLSMVGAAEFVRKLPRGLDHPILEGGQGLSGGQRQAILLARLLIRQPSIVLLDEPTASMDEATERNFIGRFADWSRGRTVIIATHRMRVLELVDRVIVIENGQIALDDTKENALQRLRGFAKVSGVPNS